MTASTPNHGQKFQFSLKAILVFMAVVGLVCALVPPAPWPWQAWLIVYLAIGLGQVYCSLASWWRLRTKTVLGRTPSQDAAPIIQFGCSLTLPAWALMMAFLGEGRWWHLSADYEDFLGLGIVVAWIGQLAGFFINLPAIRYLPQRIDATLRLLVILNVAHLITLTAGCVGLSLEVAEFWRRY